MHLPQNADVANDTDKEVATSANADAVAVPVAAISSRFNRAKLIMQLRDRTSSLPNISNNSSDFLLLPQPPFLLDDV